MNTIEIHTAAGVAQVALNRPDKLNAINDEMRAELTTAFAAFDADPAVRRTKMRSSESLHRRQGATRRPTWWNCCNATALPPPLWRRAPT